MNLKKIKKRAIEKYNKIVTNNQLEQYKLDNFNYRLREYYNDLDYEVIISIGNLQGRKNIMIVNNREKLRLWFCIIYSFNKYSFKELVNKINRDYLNDRGIDLELEITRKRNLRDNLTIIDKL